MKAASVAASAAFVVHDAPPPPPLSVSAWCSEGMPWLWGAGRSIYLCTTYKPGDARQ